MKKFKLEVTVYNKQKLFDELDLGDCFTRPCIAGIGGIWIGFIVYIKTDVARAREINNDGITRYFQASDPVVKIKIGDVIKPEVN